MYRSLDPEKTTQTLKTLNNRIEERFPGASLGRVCREVLMIAAETRLRAEWAGKQLTWIRVAVMSVLGTAFFAGVYAVRHIRIQGQPELEELDAGFNVLVLLGAAIFFLLSLESRIKRHRILQALHELRSIAHVIDMHQLTKDPSQIIATASQRTPSSPRHSLTAFQLTRYLDYCSELLSLLGKLAALYSQSTSDGIVLQAVNDIEQLTNGLSRKIWQKIMMLDNDITAEDYLAHEQSLKNEAPESV
jgi:hypothetical protein